MVEQDTIRLLRECDAGVRMGAASIADVLAYIKNEKLRELLERCKAEHDKLQTEITRALHRFQEDGKDPNPMARGMAMLKSKMEITMQPRDETIASLMTDGCSMGAKSLNKYLNEYEAADEHAKDITKRLIRLEEQLISDLRAFL